MTTTSYKQIACYITPAQHRQLQALSKRTRVPQQVYLREGVTLLLAKYNKAART